MISRILTISLGIHFTGSISTWIWSIKILGNWIYQIQNTKELNFTDLKMNNPQGKGTSNEFEKDLFLPVANSYYWSYDYISIFSG